MTPRDKEKKRKREEAEKNMLSKCRKKKMKHTKKEKEEKNNAIRFTSNTLDPSYGVFRDRLKVELGHWPEPSNKKLKCQLHRWVLGRKVEYTRGVCKCSFCGVNLCMICFKQFHTCAALVEEKDAFASKLKAMKDEREGQGGSCTTSSD